MIKIGIIGPNTSMCSEELYNFGVQLGENITAENRAFICGGMAGFMEAVCKGIKQSPLSYNGQTIGILPSDKAELANPYIDVGIPTGMGVARNLIIINTADIIIAAGGGAGTLSEIAFAWQKKKTVLCLQGFGGWAAELANKNLDKRASGLLIGVCTVLEISNYINNFEK